MSGLGVTSWQLYVWVVSVLLAAAGGYGTAWAVGFRRGVTWARNRPERRGPWPARERRKTEQGPPSTERRADRQPERGRHAGPPTAEIPVQQVPQAPNATTPPSP